MLLEFNVFHGNFVYTHSKDNLLTMKIILVPTRTVVWNVAESSLQFLICQHQIS